MKYEIPTANTFVKIQLNFLNIEATCPNLQPFLLIHEFFMISLVMAFVST